MMRELDARGLVCPQPVIRTRAMLEESSSGDIKVIVDNASARENVQRFLEFQGFNTAISEQGDDYLIIGSHGGETIERGTGGREPEQQSAGVEEEAARRKKIMVMCATDRIGYGDDELGKKLMTSFLKTLNEMGDELWRLVLVNNGVKLAIDGSDALEDLKCFEKNGLNILVCGTCLAHFELLEKKEVGETTNMLDIVTAMQLADKVINM
jgi:selenium metabolism protein YedF